MDRSNIDSLESNQIAELMRKNAENRQQKVAARRRWAILAKALKSPIGSEPSSPTEECSVRRISSFKLLSTQQLAHFAADDDDAQVAKRTWYRADYWVSQSKKYCDFCKCWITDNRPSVDFHEKGRRHQENVKKRLRNITKVSTQNQRSLEKVDVTIRHMESAALEAYKKDMENGGDLSSMIQRSQGSSSVTKIWHEHKSRDGKSYYVNMMTRETVWRAPAEGYLSITEQREQSLSAAQKQLKEYEKFKKQEAMKTMYKVQQEEAEEEARKNREKMKARRVVDEVLPLETCGPLIEPGKIDPYGKWKVVKESEPVMDLQLPEQNEYVEPPIEYEPEPPAKEFKEKVVETLGGGETSFKKRKFNDKAKRNTRQRLDDE